MQLHQIRHHNFILIKVSKDSVESSIQGLFKAFGCFSSTFQGKSDFQGFFKTVMYIQVLFKPVLTLPLQQASNFVLYIFFLNLQAEFLMK